MLKIRLSRVGRKHEPVYRLVLTEHQNAAKSGKSLKILGNFDSRNAEKAEFNAEKIKYWMSKGAQVSPTVHNILVSKGVLTGKKVNVLPKGVIEAAKNKILENKKMEAQKGDEEAAKSAPVAEPETVPEEAPEAESAPAETTAHETPAEGGESVA